MSVMGCLEILKIEYFEQPCPARATTPWPGEGQPRPGEGQPRPGEGRLMSEKYSFFMRAVYRADLSAVLPVDCGQICRQNC